MNVEILVDGPYGKFNPGGKQTVQRLKAGDVVELPDEYALDLIASRLAKAAAAAIVQTKAREVIFEEDLNSDLSLPEQMAADNAERHPKEEATGKEIGKLLKSKKGGS